MEEISNNKKRNLVIIASLVLVVGLLAGTYAIFNYTKTGDSNSFSTSLVDFTFTDGNLIDVSNEFPLDENLNLEDLTAAQNAHNGSLSITGHTSLANGIDYKIYVVHGDDINNKVRLNDSNIKFQLEPDFTSGQNGFTVKSNDYSDPTNLVFDNDGKALISTGLIKGTTQQTTVNYNYHFWIDGGSINISSTTKRETLAEGNPSLADSTTGNTTATRYMRNDNTEASTVTLFPAETNQVGKIIYTTYEFSNGYYNLKIVVEAVEHKENAFDIVAKNVDTTTQINFANAASESNGEGLYILPGTENDTNPIYYYRGAVTNNNVIFGEYCWQMVRTTDTGGIKMIYNGVATGNGTTCENTAHADRIISSSAFNSQYNTVADVGYMKNARYTYSNGAGATGSIYGKNVEWDGTNYLVIEDTANTASSNTTKDNNHHYSCGTAGTTSCASVRYYYYNNYYITLTNGEKVEDALYKMTGNGDAVTKARNTGYVLNQNDSTIKTAIESWFRTNLTNEVDSTKRNYVSYLEDTIYCNDRSFKTTTGNTSIPTYEQSGWNPNGGDLTKQLYFGTWNRYYNNWYSTSNVPSVACPNETDRFSVSSGVAHLNYPVGLLSGDEAILAGIGGNGANNSSYYLYTGNYYWSLSPFYFDDFNARGFNVLDSLYGNTVNYSGGLRPVVSLKLGTEFEKTGDGTPTNPYVVKYN